MRISAPCGLSADGAAAKKSLLLPKITQKAIDILIGDQISNHLVRVQDYFTENGLSFGKIKAQLQAEADNLK